MVEKVLVSTSLRYVCISINPPFLYLPFPFRSNTFRFFLFACYQNQYINHTTTKSKTLLRSLLALS